MNATSSGKPGLELLTLALFLGIPSWASGQAAPTMRRVVTGWSEEGRSIVVADAPTGKKIVFESLPGFAVIQLWATRSAEEGTTVDLDPLVSLVDFVPNEGGSRFLVFQLPTAAQVAAATEASGGPEAFHAEYATKIPDLAASHDPDNPGLHRTKTTDYVIVLSGHVVLELDDGEHVELSSGDVVVQRGTRHAWHNSGDEPALLAAVMVGNLGRLPDSPPSR